MIDHYGDNLSLAARKLSRHLARAGAFARISSLDIDKVDLFLKAGAGPTLGAGTAPASCVAELLEAGRVRWIGPRLEASHVEPADDLGPHSDPALMMPEGQQEPVIINRSESPLTWLASRLGTNGQPLLSPCCVAAGERLRADLERAAMLPRMGTDWTRLPSAKGGSPLRDEPGMAALAARQRCEAALSAVGPDLSGLLLDVCGFLKRLSLIEMERGWPPRSARIVLGLALKRLADHYGLGDVAVGPAPARQRHHVWRPDSAVPDQRPGSG